jgi:acyl-CoA reductase-like NAD-dependent aldehyde dehydrogenase
VKPFGSEGESVISIGSVATDDPAVGERIAGRLHAFTVGINRLRSRGDREEPFGGAADRGRARSWAARTSSTPSPI